MQLKKVLLSIILILLVLGVGYVAVQLWTAFNTPTITTQYPEQIREYNGTALDSINDFRIEAIAGVQYINISTYSLVIDGLVQNQTSLTYNDLVNNHTSYLKVVTLHCVEGWQVTALWQGLLVKDLLADAGYEQNAQVLIFYAQDGYTTSLPLSYIVNNNIMIAYKVNNVTLPAAEGYPFQLVAEGKLGYKWIKWITRISVSNDTSYLGYWESNGYSNTANYP